MVIFDNDEGFLLPDTGVSVNENVGTLLFAIARSGASNRAASVDYATANGTAVAGSDYSAVSGTLTWAAGDSDFKTIEIPITNDQDDENERELHRFAFESNGRSSIGGKLNRFRHHRGRRHGWRRRGAAAAAGRQASNCWRCSDYSTHLPCPRGDGLPTRPRSEIEPPTRGFSVAAAPRGGS